jgi:ankyrin repeat protein
MEAVLSEKVQDSDLVQSSEANDKFDEATDADRTEPAEKSSGQEIFSEILKRQWDEVIRLIQATPEEMYRADTKLVLHEACKNEPTLELIECLLEANKEAVNALDEMGYLPLHQACASGATIAVARKLVGAFPESVKLEDLNEKMLPLHHASKCGASKEVIMLLLTEYPEATLIKDLFARTPMDYAKSITSDDTRKTTVACLEQGPLLCAVAKAARTRFEREEESRFEELEQAHSKQTNQLELIEGEMLTLRNCVKEHQEREKHLQSQIAYEKIKHVAVDSALKAQEQTYKSFLEQENEKVAKLELTQSATEFMLENKIKSLNTVQAHKEEVIRQLLRKVSDLDKANAQIKRFSDRMQKVDSLLGAISTIAREETNEKECDEHTGYEKIELSAFLEKIKDSETPENTEDPVVPTKNEDVGVPEENKDVTVPEEAVAPEKVDDVAVPEKIEGATPTEPVKRQNSKEEPEMVMYSQDDQSKKLGDRIINSRNSPLPQLDSDEESRNDNSPDDRQVTDLSVE